jgi:uncharacterized protein YndB with AHSA1/START domain
MIAGRAASAADDNKNAMTLLIDQTVDIDAPPAIAWRALTDLDRYGEWNPFVVRCRSTLRPGDPIRMRVKVLPWFAQPQWETVRDHAPQRLLSYGIALPTGMLHSDRAHRFDALADGRTRYRSTFHLRGWLAPLVTLLLGNNLRRGFGEMTVALKLRAETL